MLATLSLVLWAAAAPPPAVVLPPEVAAHYRDLNFVNAFSTRRERIEIEDHRGAAKDHRLAKVEEAMRRVAAAIDEVDPKMARVLGREASPELTQPSALVRVLSFTVDEAKGEATAQVEALALEDAVQGSLLAKFPEMTRDGRAPSEDEILRTAGPTSRRSLEIHRWRRTESGWRREAATLLFVK